MPTDVGSEINGHNQSINYTEPPVSLQVDAGDGNSVLVTGLNEYTLYVFEIFASTRIGSGPSAWETARTHHTRKPIDLDLLSLAQKLLNVHFYCRSRRSTSKHSDLSYK